MATKADIIAAINLKQDELATSGTLLAPNADRTWMIIAGILVFFMHAGFTMLEAGSVRSKSSANILFKNLGTISIGSIMWFVTGYGFAYGAEEDNYGIGKYIGTGNFFAQDLYFEAPSVANNGYATWFFQAMFAATAATIVSGAVAGRIKLSGYFILAIWLTGFVYPVVCHVFWYTGGWLSSFNQGDANGSPYFLEEDGGTGMIDFAGSGVVHMTGGVAAFWAALILGARLGRFETPEDFAPHNVSYQALGTFILWFGWYGFNCGSTLVMDGDTAGVVAVTTTLAPAAAVCVGIIVPRLIQGYYDINCALNGALAGLVSITAPCGNVTEGSAIAIGAIGFVIFYGSSKLMKLIKVDDPVDAIAVHGFCGIWGCIAAGLFNADGTTGVIMTTQFTGVGFILGWVTVTVLPVIIVLKLTGQLRVTAEEEETGLDASEHAGLVSFINKE